MVVSRKRLLRKGLIELDVVEIVFISDITWTVIEYTGSPS